LPRRIDPSDFGVKARVWSGDVKAASVEIRKSDVKKKKALILLLPLIVLISGAAAAELSEKEGIS